MRAWSFDKLNATAFTDFFLLYQPSETALERLGESVKEREREQSLCVCTQWWDVLVHKFSWLYTMPRSTTCSWNIENSIKLPVSSGCAVTMLHASTPFWINPSILLWQTLEHMEIVNKIYFLNLFSKYSSQICCHTHIRFDSGPSFVRSRYIYNTHSPACESVFGLVSGASTRIKSYRLLTRILFVSVLAHNNTHFEYLNHVRNTVSNAYECVLCVCALSYTGRMWKTVIMRCCWKRSFDVCI